MFRAICSGVSLVTLNPTGRFNVATDKAGNLITANNVRRSTRVSQIVPVTISSRNSMESSFWETTSTLAMNCHGCLCRSQNEYRTGSSVILEIPAQQANGKPHSVSAQVRFVRRSQNPSEPYHVGVEFQAPANIWGIQAPPADWLQFPTDAEIAANLSALAPACSSDITAPAEKTIHVLPKSSGTVPETAASAGAKIQPSEPLPGSAMRVEPEEVK
jgi:hypothetical protein